MPEIQSISRTALLTLLSCAVAFLSAPVSATEDPLPESLLNPTQVETIGIDDFQRVLESHVGEVVLINFWATWCIPCVQELPELNELQKRFRDQGLKVIAVSLDEPENQEAVETFFKKRAPDLISYLSEEKESFDFVAALDPEWIGALPSTYFLDRTGGKKRAATGRLSYQRFEEIVTELLASDTP